MRKLTKFHKAIIISLFITLFLNPLYSEETTPLPYESTAFPQFLKDLRRFEIISIGSLPFVTLNTTLVYSGIKYVDSGFDSTYTPNPFAASTYTTDEQKTIILSSVAVCAAIGLTDYIIQIVKRNKEQRRLKLLENEDISIYQIYDAESLNKTDNSITPIEDDEVQIDEEDL